ARSRGTRTAPAVLAPRSPNAVRNPLPGTLPLDGGARLSYSNHKLPQSRNRVRSNDPFLWRGGGKMKGSERRQLTRFNLRTPLRFRAIGLSSDKTEHFKQALDVSR